MKDGQLKELKEQLSKQIPKFEEKKKYLSRLEEYKTTIDKSLHQDAMVNLDPNKVNFSEIKIIELEGKIEIEQQERNQLEKSGKMR